MPWSGAPYSPTSSSSAEAHARLGLGLVGCASGDDGLLDEVEHMLQSDRGFGRVNDGFELGFETHKSVPVVSCRLSLTEQRGPATAYLQSSRTAACSVMMASKPTCLRTAISPNRLLLPHLDRLQPDHLEQREKHAHQRLPRGDAHAEAASGGWGDFQRQAASQIVDHLAYCDGFFVDVDHGPRAYAFQHLLECFDQVDHIGGDLRLGAFGLYEFLQGRVG